MNSNRKTWHLREKCNERAQRKDDWFREWPEKNPNHLEKDWSIGGSYSVYWEEGNLLPYCLWTIHILIFCDLVFTVECNRKYFSAWWGLKQLPLRFASAPCCFQWALTKCFRHRCCANVLYELFVLSQCCEIRSPFPQCVKQIKMKACFYGPETVQIKKKGKKKKVVI